MLPELPDPKLDPRLWGDVDGPTLLAAASALQLDPANTASLHGLRRLAAVAAELPARPDARPLSSSKVKSLLAVRGVGDAITAGFQDPYEGLLVVEVPYFGGPHLSMQGLATHCAKIAEFLLTAILAAPKATLPGTFIVKVRALARLLLTVSDRACRGAGLTRWSTPGEDGTRAMVPSATTLSERARWVQFDEEELFEGLHALAREYLTIGLVREQGTPVPIAGTDRSEWSMVQPLVRSGSTLTVQAPPDLLAALRHHIVRAAIEEYCLPQLVQAMLAYATHKAKELLNGLVDEPLRTVEEGRNWVRLQSQFDSDKLMDLFVVVDDLENYDPFSAYGTWDGDDVFKDLVERSADGDRVLRIFLTSVIGRDLRVRGRDSAEPTPTLFAGWDDLETILQTPDLGNLGLWYFACALLDLHQRSELRSFSIVDTFELYREHGMSFYLSDDALPDAADLAVGYGQELRYANAFRHDRRRFIKYDGDGWVEGWSVHGRGTSPVYIALLRDGAAYVADLGDITVWVRIPPVRSRHTNVGADTLMVAAEATAYWMWQLWLVDAELIRRASNDFGVVELLVHGARIGETFDTWVRVTKTEDARFLTVSSPRPGDDDARTSSPENEVDRDLLAALYDSLGGEDASAVGQIAPPGLKGMIHLTNASAITAWAPLNTPVWTGSEAVVAQVLDGLGRHLSEELGMPVGTIRPDRRILLLTQTVAPWLIDRLHDELLDLDGTGLAERLVERSEALIAYSSRESERLPARIACFGVASDEVQGLQRRLALASDTMMASRFLVELASAFPPAGGNALNQERYDRLLALSSEIINKGMLVDSLRSGVSDVQLSILGSGRLGTAREGDAYVQAVGMFSRFRAQTVLADAVDPRPGERDGLPDLAMADELAQDAFGFTYTDVFDAVAALTELLEDRQTVSTTRAEAARELAEQTGWDQTKVSAVLDALTLAPFSGTFAQFWEDLPSVAPWRFNRDRSYLKRPLIANGPGLVFGRRMLRHAPIYWFESFRTGRLQAKGKIAGAMSRQRTTKGRAFEREVAALLARVGCAPVKERLRRVGNYDFRNIDGRDLGDIDVAAVRASTQEVLLVEAKDLEVARTPTELRNELNQLVGPGNSAITRLRERAQWVRTHAGAVLKEFGIDGSSGWSIRPIVVVKQPLLSEHLELSSDIPIIAIERLEEHLQPKARQ
ncbi:hypothetical protein Q9R20_06430 [Microbacterium sp. PRF11]|uniref:hypothetical protein n=1 Tax=Microbacterium sp. PRF11 TaxID=2962593 RepID=UPI002882739F|nr:hypothetical protein [Microbacterium sp. PRF11]MDT0116624.1 hypothetical protein [Microbacterium sp. PRF11]